MRHLLEGDLPPLLERLPERYIASALVERSKVKDTTGALLAALVAEEEPQGRSKRACVGYSSYTLVAPSISRVFQAYRGTKLEDKG